MKILVIGGAGYLGSVFCKRNCGEHEITVLDNFWFWDRPGDFSHEVFGLTNHRAFEFDIRKPQGIIEDCIVNCDIIVNLACISNDPSSDLDPVFTHDVSYNGVCNVIDWAVVYDKRIIHISSNSIYGSRGETVVHEDLDPQPLTQYSKLKVEIEHKLDYLYKYNNFKSVILRPSTLCGFSPRLRLDLTVNMFIHQALKNNKITVYGGDQYRPAIHIHDMSRIIELFLDGKFNHNVYNCGREFDTVLNIAKVAQKLTGCDLEVLGDNKDDRSYTTTSKKLEKEKNFKYRYSYEQAMKDIIWHYESDGIDEKYTNNMNVMKRVIGDL